MGGCSTSWLGGYPHFCSVDDLAVHSFFYLWVVVFKHRNGMIGMRILINYYFSEAMEPLASSFDDLAVNSSRYVVVSNSILESIFLRPDHLMSQTGLSKDWVP